MSVLVVPPAVHAQAGPPAFTLFESGQVRPLALSPNQSLLFAANTPDNRLEVFRITATGIEPCGSIPVGLEPVAVAARTDREIWVVNHLSDSISIVTLDAAVCGAMSDEPELAGWVSRTLLVGDEPRDLIFAGPERNRAFITTAHRGQHRPSDPQLTTPGVGRADVWVFDTTQSDDTLGGTPLTIITLFTDTPRALAATPDGRFVYAAGFQTGNQTTTVFADIVRRNGGLPGPQTNVDGELQPSTGLIVQFDGTNWVDDSKRPWTQHVNFTLPDRDVFVLDAAANPPAAVAGPSGFFTQVGTVLFNMIVNPANGHIYVSNTEARNVNRFEGPGTVAGSTLRGHLHTSRITVLQPGSVQPRHLNKHIDYTTCCAAIPNPENQASLAFPMEMAITSDGTTLYVVAFGSSKIGIYNTTELDNDTFKPTAANHITVTGGGPSGIVLDEARNRLYVLTRFDNSISIIDTTQYTEVAHIPMFNPEPASIVQGRRFLYDAATTSSHGDTACASCHVFGDVDSLAWDLGNPDATTLNNPGPFALSVEDGGGSISPHFHPMKGPMMTQSLRGLANHGPMHWRGDRLGGNDTPSVQPNSGIFDEEAAFKKFNPAFKALNGRHAELTPAEMQALTDFVLQLTYPPNPIRNLDNTLTPDEQAGRDFYFSARASDGTFNCNGCHVLDPSGNAEFAVSRPGFFGTDGRYSFEALPQVFKVPHLRNLYQKVGMFGMPRTEFILPESLFVENASMGDQVRGFGFLHDGSVDTIFRFLNSFVFLQLPNNPGGFPFTPDGDQQRRQVEQFLLVFDSNLAPIVGHQITLTTTNATAVLPRLDLLQARAEVGECDLVAKQHGQGFLYKGTGQFIPDQAILAPLSSADLQARVSANGGEITYTCVPPGSGRRLGIDRNANGILDGDE